MTPDTNLTSDTVTSAQASCVLPSTILLLWFHNPHSEFDVLKLPSADGPRSVMKRCCHVKQKTIFMRSWKTFYVLKHPIQAFFLEIPTKHCFNEKSQDFAQNSQDHKIKITRSCGKSQGVAPLVGMPGDYRIFMNKSRTSYFLFLNILCGFYLRAASNFSMNVFVFELMPTEHSS